MICYELFEGRKPFSEMTASAAARAASLFDRRPPWGKANRCMPLQHLFRGATRQHMYIKCILRLSTACSGPTSGLPVAPSWLFNQAASVDST